MLVLLATYEYHDNGGNMSKMAYGNGQYVTYEYDLFDRLITEVYHSSTGAVIKTKRYLSCFLWQLERKMDLIYE